MAALKLGDFSLDVVRLQLRLDLFPTGYFDDRTHKAVLKFQKAHSSRTVMTTPTRILLAFLLATLAACTDPASAPASSAPTPADTYYSMKPCPESAQQFWTKFRAAVLKHDFDALAAMTHFPLEVSGDGDNSPKKFVDRKNFNKHFAYLLNLDMHGSEYDPNPKPIPATMKEFARAVANVTSLCMPDGDEISGDQLNVAKWTFLSKPDGWQLHFVHSDDFISIKTEEPLHVTPIESLQLAPIRK